MAQKKYSVLSRLRDNRRGNVLIVAALAMPIVVGAAGLATDTVQWSLAKRVLQQQADAGSMSGAFAKGQGADPIAAVKSDLSATTKMVLLGNPVIENAPTVGAYAGDTSAVRVALKAENRLPFSAMFLSSTPVIAVEATSKLVSDGQYCIIALDRNSTTGINIAGNATLDLGCGIAANASGANAITASGSSIVNITAAAAVGTVQPSGSYVTTAKVYSHSLPQADPFASGSRLTVESD